MKKSLKKQAGFTLIELLTTAIVLAIVAAIGIPSYRNFIGNTQIRSTAESIRNGLQVARAEAIKRNAIVSFQLSNDSAWTVGCPNVTAVCPAQIQTKPAKEGGSSTISLALTGLNSVRFTSLGTVDPSVADQLSQVNIDNTNLNAADSRDLRILIGVGGVTRMCDPNVAATTDTRKC